LSKINIEISNNQKVLTIDPRQLHQTVRLVLRRLDCNKALVSLAVVDNDTMGRLREKYLGNPELTDVLSFDLRDRTCAGDDKNTLDCEVVVNAERARQVARAHNADPLAELNLYVVHGLLHQLGYDDRNLRQARIMHEKEDQFLQELGFGKVYYQGDKKR